MIPDTNAGPATLSTPHQWTPLQWDAVHAAFTQHFKGQLDAGSPLAKHVDWNAGWRAITQGDTHAVIADGYLIVYDVGSFWYATAPVFFEQMVLRLDNTPGNYGSVLRAIESVVKHHGCVGAVTGNAVGRRGLTRAYERAGYQAVATQLYKEMKVWDH